MSADDRPIIMDGSPFLFRIMDDMPHKQEQVVYSATRLGGVSAVEELVNHEMSDWVRPGTTGIDPTTFTPLIIVMEAHPFRGSHEDVMVANALGQSIMDEDGFSPDVDPRMRMYGLNTHNRVGDQAKITLMSHSDALAFLKEVSFDIGVSVEELVDQDPEKVAPLNLRGAVRTPEFRTANSVHAAIAATIHDAWGVVTRVFG